MPCPHQTRATHRCQAPLGRRLQPSSGAGGSGFLAPGHTGCEAALILLQGSKPEGMQGRAVAGPGRAPPALPSPSWLTIGSLHVPAQFLPSAVCPPGTLTLPPQGGLSPSAASQDRACWASVREGGGGEPLGQALDFLDRWRPLSPAAQRHACSPGTDDWASDCRGHTRKGRGLRSPRALPVSGPFPRSLAEPLLCRSQFRPGGRGRSRGLSCCPSQWWRTACPSGHPCQFLHSGQAGRGAQRKVHGQGTRPDKSP